MKECLAQHGNCDHIGHSMVCADAFPRAGLRSEGHKLHSHHIWCSQTRTEQLGHLQEHLPIKKMHQLAPAPEVPITLPHISLT